MDTLVTLDAPSVNSIKISNELNKAPSVTRRSDKNVDATLKNVRLACWTAKAVLGDDVVTTQSEDEKLTELMEVNWSQTCWLKPHCVLSPKTTDQVSQLMKIISKLGARFSVRSGGHSPNPGYSGTDTNGVLVDLSGLNQITVSVDKKVARIGPGNRWGHVYEELDKYKMTVAGGRIPYVGVGGLVLGGGLSHWASEYGMVADTVKNFEVVLSDGSVVNANVGNNTDLFWALKGGGPNFGIVTRFDFNALPIHNIWYAAIEYAPNQTDDVLEAFVNYESNGALDPKASVIIDTLIDSTVIFLVYSAPVERPEAFAPFFALPPMKTLVSRLGTVNELSKFIGMVVSNEPKRHDYRAFSTKIDLDLYKDMHAFWRSQINAVHESTGANMTFVLQHITVAHVEAAERSGGNPLGLPAIPHQWYSTLIDWESIDHDNIVRGMAINVTDKWQEESTKRGADLPYLFMNDAAREQNPLASYGSENVAKLKAVSLKYDPLQVFQKLQADGFLLRDL